MFSKKIALNDEIRILLVMPFKIFDARLGCSNNFNEIESLLKKIVEPKIVEIDDAIFFVP